MRGHLYMVSVTQLFNTLQRIGIKAGDVLILESPGVMAPDIEEGLEKLATVLQTLVGPTGTLVIPTCTPAEGYPKPTFDLLLSPSEMGAFSEFFRTQQPNVVRSHNPTHSIAARGPLADNLIAGHRTASGRPTPWGDGSFGYGSPWDLLYEHNAWWVLIGSDSLPSDPWLQTPFTAYVQTLYAYRQRDVTRQTLFPRFNPTALGQ